MRSAGPKPSAAAAIEGSVKYRVSDVRIAVFERKLGFHASTSSTTKILFSALMYDAIVSSSRESPSLATRSARIVE